MQANKKKFCARKQPKPMKNHRISNRREKRKKEDEKIKKIDRKEAPYCTIVLLFIHTLLHSYKDARLTTYWRI